MTKALIIRRRISLLAAAAPVALMLGMASSAMGQVATPGGNTAAGVVSNTYTMSGAGPTFAGATTNTGGADTSTITLNDSRTLLNWNSFNLAPGDTLNFNMGSASAIALNRVLGGSGTVINGAVNSNGNVWFLDSSGIAVGGTAVVNVGGLLLSSLGLADADFFDGNGSFHFTGAGGNAVTVNGGAALTASNGAVTVVAPSMNFSGAATANGSIGLFAARNATLVFDADLDAYVALTVGTGSDQNTAITVGSQASFNAAAASSGGRTYLIAAGDNGALGSILLGGTAADAVEFVEGDVVIYAAGESLSDRQLISGGALQASTGSGGGDVLLGAANVSAGDLNVIAADDVTVNDLVTVANGSARFESIDLTSISVGVQVGRNYTLRAADWTGGAAFSPVFLNAASGVGDFTIQDTAWGLTIGGRTAPGRFSITSEGGSLTIMGGAITAGDGISLSASGGDLTLSSNLVDLGADDDVSLSAGGAITQTAGGITADLLSVQAGLSATLTGANTVSRLGASAADGLTLVDAGGLTTTGLVSGGSGGISLTTSGDLTVGGALATANGPVTLEATGAGSDIQLNAPVSAGTGAVRLTALGTGGTINQNASGVISATTLAGASDGATTLTAATNAITNLWGFTGNGVSLRDASGLTVTNVVNGGSGGVNLTTSGDLLVGAAVSATDAAVSLTATGVNSDIRLDSAVSAGSGAVAISAWGANGTITQAAGGVITAGLLTGGSEGSTVLTSANQLSALGAFSANGFSLVDVNGLVVSGAVDGGATGVNIAAGGGLTVNGAVSTTNGPVSLSAGPGGADLVLTSSINAGSGTVSLSAGDAISQTAGGVIAGTLTVTSGGAAAFGAGAADNDVVQLGAVTTGDFSFRNVDGFSTAGAVASNGDVTLIAETGTLTLGANVSGDVVALTASTGDINQTAGVITADTLTGFAGRHADLGEANRIVNLGGFVAEDFTLVDADGLTVVGSVGGGTSGGDVLIRTSGGPLALASTSQVSGESVVLSTDGAFVNQSGADALLTDGRWTIYAAAPTTSVFGGLDSGSTAIWNATLATRAPATLTGNRYVFAYQPTLTVTTQSANKVYGTDLTGSTGGLWAVSGYHAGVAGAFLGDTAATAFSGAPTITSSGLAERASVAGGPYAVNASLGTLASDSGYAFGFSNVGQITVTPKGLVAGVTAADKTYDQTTAAVGTVTLTGVVDGDSVSTTAGTFAFADSDAGTDKVVTVNGVSLTGAGAGNYTLTVPASVLADILRRALTVTITADDKTYDGTSAGTGTVSLAGVLGGDDVSTTTGTFTFADRNAGTDKVVTIAGVSLTGADAGNYNLTVPASVLADILRRELTATVTAGDKTYDGTTAGAGSVSLAGVLGGDDVSTTAGTFTFADRNAGTDKVVTVGGVSLTGGDAGNYSLAIPVSVLADILRRELNATVTAGDKTYDGTTSGAGSVSLVGVLGGDDVSTTAGTFTFADRNAGTDKVVTIAGVSLTGADAGNYNLTVPASVLADILRRELTATVTAGDKTYDGTTAGAGSVSLVGVLGGDDVSTTAGTFTFADRNAGTDKVVTVTGVNLTGGDAGNYSLTVPANVLADILRREITATVAVADKTYDGTTAGSGSVSLVGVLGGDAVEASGGTFTFSDANAGTGKTVAVGGVGLTGSDASNYSVVVPGSVVASILRRAITVTADAKSKREGQADPVLTYAVTGGGLVAGDTLTGALAREAGETPGDYAITQGGLAATANYQLTFVGNTLTIEVAPVGAPETPIVEAARQLVGFLTQYAPAAGDSQALVVIDERACEGVEGEKSEGCGA